MTSKSKRRVANGKGSIYRDSQGRWRASLAWMAAGKLVRKYRTRQTRREAEQALDELKQLAGQPVSQHQSQDMTVSDLLEMWMVSKAELSEATRANYRNQIDTHLKPALGSIRLKDLTEAQLEACLPSLDVGTATLRKIIIVLRGSLNLAMRKGLMAPISLYAVKGPGWKRESDPQPFNRAEVAILLKQPGHYQCMLRLMLSVGLRPGEVAGLRWQDITLEGSGQDAEHGLLRVSRTRQEVNGVVSFKEPKSKAGARSVALDEKLKKALAKHREQAIRKGQAARSDLVFVTPQGCVLRRNNLANHYWLPLLRRLAKKHKKDSSVNFEPRGLHQCRHTAATLMLGAGVPVHVVSGILGHEKTSYTWDLYSHLLPEQQAEAVRLRSAYL